MKKRLLVLSLVLSMFLVACGSEVKQISSDTSTRKEKTETVEVESDIEDDETITSGLDIVLLTYDYLDVSTDDDENNSFTILNRDEKVFCLNANCSKDSLTNYYFAFIELGKVNHLFTNAYLELTSDNLDVVLLLNNADTIVLTSNDGGKTINYGWDVEPEQPSNCELEKAEITDLYNRALNGESIGF